MEQEVTDSKGQQLVAHEIAQNKFVLSSRYLQVARAIVAIIKNENPILKLLEEKA